MKPYQIAAIVLLSIAAYSILTSKVSIIDSYIYRVALNNFTYEADVADERRIYDSVTTPFTGDCEDFAFTLQKQLGGEVWYTFKDGQAHAVLVKNEMIFDNNAASPIPTEEWPSKLLFVMTE